MNERAPTATEQYEELYPDAVKDANKAHAMAIESNKTRSEAARARGIGKLILEEVNVGTDKWGRGAAERIADRTQAVEEHVYRTGNYITVSEDMQPDELQKAGLNPSNDMSGHLQHKRFTDARLAIKNNGGDGAKAVEQIDEYSKRLDGEADAIEEAAADEYNRTNNPYL